MPKNEITADEFFRYTENYLRTFSAMIVEQCPCTISYDDQKVVMEFDNPPCKEKVTIGESNGKCAIISQHEGGTKYFISDGGSMKPIIDLLENNDPAEIHLLDNIFAQGEEA